MPRLASIARTLVLLLVLPAFAPVARAQDRSDRTTRADRQHALTLFHQGVAEYRVGHFLKSAALMRQAYAIHPEPVLQYNLARALESAGQLEGAAGAYQRYLDEDDNPPDRGAVEERIRTLRRQIAEHNADTLEQQARAASQPHPAAPPPQPTPLQRIGPLPWIVAGSGVVVVGVGIVFGVLAQSRHDAAVNDPVHQSAAQAASDSSRWALVANVAFVAGGIITAAGIGWGVVSFVLGGNGADSDASQAQSQPRAQLDVGPGSVSVRGVF